MDWSGFFYAPMAFLVENPWLTALVTLALVGLAVARRGKATLAAAILWLAYSGWEALVQYRTPDADIRFDLLLIWPVLLVAALLAIIFAFRRRNLHGK